MINELLNIAETSTRESDITVYGCDASQVVGRAKAVVWPTSAAQVSEVVKLCAKTNTALVARGAGTGLLGGAVPQNAIVIDLSRMNKILRITPGRVFVEPGLVIADLNDKLAETGQYFPVIPASHHVATVGGAISTNASGMRAIRYGPMREWIVELEAVDGTGKVLAVRGASIDDFCGAEGTTGIITGALLKLTPTLEQTSLSIFTFDVVSGVQEKVAELVKNPHVISIEFVDQLTAREIGSKPLNYIFAEFDNLSGEVSDPVRIEELWQVREGSHPALCASGRTVTDDVTVPLSKLEEFLMFTKSNEVPVFGHIGLGILHPYYLPDSPLLEEVRKKVIEFGGSLISEHGVGLLKKDYVTPEMKKRFEALKKKYDPQRIVNRGKIV